MPPDLRGGGRANCAVWAEETRVEGRKAAREREARKVRRGRGRAEPERAQPGSGPRKLAPARESDPMAPALKAWKSENMRNRWKLLGAWSATEYTGVYRGCPVGEHIYTGTSTLALGIRQAMPTKWRRKRDLAALCRRVPTHTPTAGSWDRPPGAAVRRQCPQSSCFRGERSSSRTFPFCVGRAA